MPLSRKRKRAEEEVEPVELLEDGDIVRVEPSKMCPTEGCGPHPHLFFSAGRSMCKACDTQRQVSYTATLKGFFVTMATSCKANAATRSGQAAVCDLISDDFIAL
jgi:hypothetical protein